MGWLSFYLVLLLGWTHLSMAQSDGATLNQNITNMHITMSTMTRANDNTTQALKSSAPAPPSTTASVKSGTATSLAATVSSSSQQTMATTQVLPTSLTKSVTDTSGKPASSQVTSPPLVSGAPRVTGTANSAAASSVPPSPTSSQVTSTSPSDGMPAVAHGVTAGHKNETLATSEASTIKHVTPKDATPTPTISVGQTESTTPPLSKSTGMSLGRDGTTLTPSFLTGTTATQAQNTTRIRGPATSMETVETSRPPTPNATSSRDATTQKSGFPGTSPTASESSPSDTSPIKVTCVPYNLSDTSVIILVQEQPRSCEQSLQPVEKGLAEILCQKVKSTFTPSSDRCTVRLGYSDDPSKLGILGVSVESDSVVDELYEMLHGKRDTLRKFGFSTVNHTSNKSTFGTEDRLTMALIITIVCMAVSLLLIAAVYGCWHQRHSTKKDQQRLTEELQTMENGYHDNPTLDVMETSPEMQEKKMGLNGELGDSWIVPIDHLSKEDLEEEEDTHL